MPSQVAPGTPRTNAPPHPAAAHAIAPLRTLPHRPCTPSHRSAPCRTAHLSVKCVRSRVPATRRTIMNRASQVLAAAVAVAFSGLSSLAAAQNKLVAPVHGEAKIEVTKPATKAVGKDVVTTILVKNVDKAPIAGFKVEEYLVRQGRQSARWGQLSPPAALSARRDHHGHAEDAAQHQPGSQPGRLRARLRADQEDCRAEAGTAEAGDVNLSGTEGCDRVRQVREGAAECGGCEGAEVHRMHPGTSHHRTIAPSHPSHPSHPFAPLRTPPHRERFISRKQSPPQSPTLPTPYRWPTAS